MSSVVVMSADIFEFLLVFIDDFILHRCHCFYKMPIYLFLEPFLAFPTPCLLITVYTLDGSCGHLHQPVQFIYRCSNKFNNFQVPMLLCVFNVLMCLCRRREWINLYVREFI